MKIAVIEDDIQYIKKLGALIKAYSRKHPGTLDIDYYLSGEQFLSEGLKRPFTYHLILMDIYMDKLDGIETARRLHAADETIPIAFLSASEEDIWRAVSTHGCFDYIRKNEFDGERLERLLTDTMKRWDAQEACLTFQAGRLEVSIRLTEIQYIVSRDKYSVIVLKNNHERSYRITFSMMADMLASAENFLLCNRGVLLNMDFIQQTDGESFTMQSGIKFPVRQKDKRKILDRFNAYQFSKLDAQEVFE